MYSSLSISEDVNLIEKSLTFLLRLKDGIRIPCNKDISSFFINALSSNLWNGEQRGKLSILSGPLEDYNGVSSRVISAELHFSVIKIHEKEFDLFCQEFARYVREILDAYVLEFSSRIIIVPYAVHGHFDLQSG